MKRNFKEFYKLSNIFVPIINEQTTDEDIRAWAAKQIQRYIFTADDTVFSTLVNNDELTPEFIENIRHVIEYLSNLNENDKKKQIRGGFAQVLSNAQEYLRVRQKREEEERKKEAKQYRVPVESGLIVRRRFEDGYAIVELTTKENYERESKTMGNCTRQCNPENVLIFSLRDEKNLPHVTMELVAAEGSKVKNQLHEIKGRSNRAPAREYQGYIKQFLKENPQYTIIGDGRNIGYVEYNRKYYDPKSPEWINIYNTKILPTQNTKLNALQSMVKEG